MVRQAHHDFYLIIQKSQMNNTVPYQSKDENDDGG